MIEKSKKIMSIKIMLHIIGVANSQYNI